MVAAAAYEPHQLGFIRLMLSRANLKGDGLPGSYGQPVGIANEGLHKVSLQGADQNP